MNFQVETTSHCDLTCVECPNAFMERKRGFIDWGVWETILHRYIVPYWNVNSHLNPPTFIPSKDGEPTLNKDLQKILSSLAQAVPGMNIDIYTHGRLLPRKPGFVDFLGTLPNRVRLMLTYHFHNHDGSENDYAPVTAYIRDRLRSWPANVQLSLSSHLVAPMTRDRLEAWRETWRAEIDKGLPVYANVNINPWTGFVKDNNLYHPNKCPYEDFVCTFFGVTGNVIACCMDLEEEIVFGNVMTTDPEYMMQTLTAFYAAQKRREVNHAVCHDCFGLPQKHDRLPKLDRIQLGRISV